MKNPHSVSFARSYLKRSILALMVGAGILAPLAHGQLTMALTGAPTEQGFANWGSEEVDGFLFRTPTGTPMVVKWLGFYDKDLDGLASNHNVRIWKVGSGYPIVASAIIPAGTVDSLEGNFRGHNITPVILEPDTEYVIADACSSDDLRTGDDLTGWVVNGITILGGRYGYPTPTEGWETMIGASFGYTQSLTILLDTPATNQAYPTGASIIASARVVEPGIALTDTVTFRMTPTVPAGPPVDVISTDTTSPYTADFGALPAGTYEIYATVTNNDAPPASNTSATHTFTIAPLTTTTTTVSSSGNPSTYGSCTLTATVSPTPAGGTVQFYYDGINYLGGPVAVNPSTGEAVIDASTLGAGSRAITADYSGFGIHDASATASAFMQSVNQAPLTVKALNTLRAPDTANPDPFPYQITGYQNGENLATSGLTGTPDLTTTAVLSSPVGDYPITCAAGTLFAGNYSFTFADGTLTITDLVDTFSVNFYAQANTSAEHATNNLLVPANLPAGHNEFFTTGWTNVNAPFSLPDPVTYGLTSNIGSTAQFVFKDMRNGWVYKDTRTTLLGDGNGNMMDGHVNATLRADGGNAPNIFDMEVTAIPFGTYDVIFYIGANQDQFGDGKGAMVFNGGPERAFTLEPGRFDGDFIEMIDASTPGNYIVIRGVTGTSFTTQIWGLGTAFWGEELGDFNHIGPFGFQIRKAAATGNTFTAWASANNALGQTPDQDHDNDGTENGIEYFMGEAGSSFTPLPGLDGINTITWPMDPAYLGAYEVQTSPDLDTWTNVFPRPTPSGGSLSYLLPPGSDKQFVRLLVNPTLP